MLHKVLLHEISKNLEGSGSVKQVCVCHVTPVDGSAALEVILLCLPEENVDPLVHFPPTLVKNYTVCVCLENQNTSKQKAIIYQVTRQIQPWLNITDFKNESDPR